MFKIKKTRFQAICAAALLLGCASFSGVVMADENSRFYLAGYMGLNIGTENDFSDKANNVSGEVKKDHGMSFAGALGLRLSKHFRVETELSYRNSDIDDFSVNGAGNISASGDIDNWLGLVNLYYDFDVPWKVKPYVTAGLGLGYYDGEVNAGNGTRFNDSAYGLTWAAGAGLQYRTSDKLSWTAGYRYLDSSELDFGSVNMDYSAHELRVGLKYDLDWK